MLAKVLSSAVLGIDGYSVEVDIAGRIPFFSNLGLPKGAVRAQLSLFSILSIFYYKPLSLRYEEENGDT
jgi:hypothetical protein